MFRAGNRPFYRLLIAVSVGLTSHFSASAQSSRQFLSHNVPSAVQNLTPKGKLSPEKRLNLSIGLPLRSEEALDHFLLQISDPQSPDYRRYLTPQQFAEKFGPAESDYEAVARFFQTNGFSITAKYPNRVVLDVSGTVADAERVFHTTLRMYPHPREARDFFAPDTEPSVDLPVKIEYVSGLDNYSLPHPKIILREPLTDSTKIIPHAGSWSNGLYAGNDFRAAYLPGIPTNQLSGAGQVIGLLEFDGYYSNDIVKYETEAGLPAVTLTNVPVNGGVSTPGTGNGEVALDIEVAIAMAPGLSKIVVYEAPNPTAWSTVLSVIANDTVNFPKQISCSWGDNAPASPNTTAENLFKQMAAQGQSFFNASGDADAFTSGIPFPSESTNITQVGGTSLSTAGPNGIWSGETTWNWGGGVGSSGGVSGNFALPSWQQGVNMTTNLGSTTKRDVPDVAMTADRILSVSDNGTNYTTAGTSAAAPLWAAFTALVNQQAVAGGKPVVGFINPAIYSIGKSPNYSSCFNDIVTGNNFWSSSTNKFPAVPGYDLATGWGSPAGDNLIDALSGVSDSLAVAPGKGFVTFGAEGGPFTAISETFFLTNCGAVSLNWSLINTSLWLTASATSGTLTPGDGGANVTLSLNPAAFALSPGIYTAHVVFTNQTTHALRDRPFALFVGQQLIQNPGFETGTLSFWAQTGIGSATYNGYNYDFADDGSGTKIAPHSGKSFAAFGASGLMGFISQTVSTVSNQTYLLSFWLNSTNNPFTGHKTTPNQFLAAWNGTILFNRTNIPVIGGWTNLQFFVTATNSASTLQFGGRDDNFYLGLDDVSLVPIPLPTINTAIKNSGGVTFSWYSLSNIQYVVQTSTNLAQTNWMDLSTNIATGSTLTATNPIADPSRFYRVRQLP
ncbi:MAG TPA: protease pro-enzyme activation domain-containing protein [Verrucomicrobiae bacterium]|nr:protease pro-enzyme activation domain-containing protein [Verrucomicrobiae bacterium]